ncbi:MAG TPA: hypothetical protein VFD58_21135 [Blastocatellia bacterium]|nr:hypothetical protein [Blastocatellia bacterium]
MAEKPKPWDLPASLRRQLKGSDLLPLVLQLGAEVSALSEVTIEILAELSGRNAQEVADRFNRAKGNYLLVQTVAFRESIPTLPFNPGGEKP